ncbi:recombination mediator RecR [Saccharospirillum mangrovi]|uniref:recombination mediator RecR n=1 Tax=Saccharospirillum mangrovi TaxID=2161747 RepID=UPI000D350F65|nr:recombination mediator RecR [Saccharospirillum mangrovi]
MSYTPLTERLMDALQVLPGVGTRSAQRMALQLLERDRAGAASLAQALSAALDGVQHCERCRALSEQPLCELCSDADRDASLLCVVETPADREAIEQSGSYSGQYFILQGQLSPIDGIGPDELGVPLLVARVSEGGVREVVLATNANMEGEATAHYLIEQLRPLGVEISRLAQGVPSGRELGRVDSSTLSHALSDRRKLGFEHD